MSFVILSAVLVWVLARWAMQGDGIAIIMGFWISLTGAFLSGLIIIINQYQFLIWPILRSGLIVGFSYSIGYCAIIMYCLKIGPAGPTVIVNNSAMVFGILFNVFWLNPHIPNSMIIIGVIGTFLSIFIIGLSKSQNNHSNVINPKWTRLVMIGGALSGISFVNQTYIGISYPDFKSSILFIFWAFAISTIILSILILSKKDNIWRSREIYAGIGIGMSSTVGLFLTLKLIPIFGSEVVFPVTVVTPMVIMMMIGHLMYKEHLTSGAWFGSILAVFSVTLLAIGSEIQY
jgi:drug/metabolite transporter (DMT)-like permease